MYCCSVWDGLRQTLDDKLQKSPNRAARVITKSRYAGPLLDVSAGPLLDMLEWDRVSIGRTKQKVVGMLITLNSQRKSQKPKDSILVICVRFYEFCIMIVLFRQFDVHFGRKPLFSLLLSMFILRDFRTILRQNFGGANKVYCGDV